jgi:hypothetical protein
MQLNVVQINSDCFSHSKDKQLLVGEVSDTGVRNFQPLYDDACDVGFALRNPRSGNVTRWALLEEIRCPREGEVLGWMFAPTPESIHRQPELKGYQLNLIND